MPRVIILLLCALRCWGAISITSIVEGGNDSVDSLDAPAADHASGDSLWVFVGFRDACGSRTLTVTDTAGNAYTSIGTPQDNASLLCSQWLYAKNIKGHAFNVVNVTVSGGTVRFLSIHVVDIVGANTSDPLDVNPVPVTQTNNQNPTSNSFTTSQSNEIILVGVKVYTGGTTGWLAGPGYTLDDYETYGASSNIQYLIVTSIQAGATAVMNTPSLINTIHVITVKEAGGESIVVPTAVRRRVIVVQ